LKLRIKSHIEYIIKIIALDTNFNPKECLGVIKAFTYFQAFLISRNSVEGGFSSTPTFGVVVDNSCSNLKTYDNPVITIKGMKLTSSTLERLQELENSNHSTKPVFQHWRRCTTVDDVNILSKDMLSVGYLGYIILPPPVDEN